MKKLRNAPIKGSTSATELEQLRTRLIARVFIIVIYVVQVGKRVYYLTEEQGLTDESKFFYLLSIPCLFVLGLINLVEFLIYKKIGSRLFKYTAIGDTLFLVFFILEWILSIEANFAKRSFGESDPCISDSTIWTFTEFGWRVLLQGFIVRRWYLKILAPNIVFTIMIVNSINDDLDTITSLMVRSLTQMFYVIFIFYFEHKMNFRLMITNMQQESWIKVNEFILDNLQENIVMLDINGNYKYISSCLKEFVEKYNSSLQGKRFFNDIQILSHQNSDETISFPSELMSPKRKSSHFDLRCEESGFDEIKNLQELATNFTSAISQGNIKEKSFLMFNGKFTSADPEDEKSIEVKISYFKHQGDSYILLIIRDTTQRDHLVTLETTNKYKDRLLASVSHELRAPLNGNINLIEAALKRPEVPKEVKGSLLSPALMSSKFLLHLINDLLDMAQIKAQKLRLIFQPGNLRETIINTLQLSELHARKKGIELHLDLDEQISESFCTDHVRLSQIILNLVNNSIKFTEHGSVTLIAKAMKDSSFVSFTVKDTGIGIKPGDLPKLFSDFTHIEHKRSPQVNPNGVGLGLNIAYNLVKLLGPPDNSGILVTSILGKGSTFSFVIEDKESGLHVQSNPDQVGLAVLSHIHPSLEIGVEPTLDERILRYLSPRVPRKLSQLSGLSGTIQIQQTRCDCSKVLIVDDDPFNIFAYESILNNLDVKFDSAYSGKSALDKILTKIRYPCEFHCKPYSLIFMDQEMPGLDGGETVQQIRILQQQHLLSKMTIIGCTGHQDKDAVERFIEFGLNECIAKPISRDIVNRLLMKYRV